MLLRRRFYFVNFWSDGSVLDPSVHFGPSNVPIQYFLISFIVSYSLPGKKKLQNPSKHIKTYQTPNSEFQSPKRLARLHLPAAPLFGSHTSEAAQQPSLPS